jgi:hypothetical protein
MRAPVSGFQSIGLGFHIHGEKFKFPLNIKTELLPLLVIICTRFPIGKLVFIFTRKIPFLENIKHHSFLPVYHIGNL